MDENNKILDEEQKEVITEVGAYASGNYVGGAAGALIGAKVGSVLGTPGPGTVTGAFVGNLIGGTIGSSAALNTAKKIVEDPDDEETGKKEEVSEKNDNKK